MQFRPSIPVARGAGWRLMSYGKQPRGCYRRARYSDCGFSGREPSELRWIRPPSSELTINLKTAKRWVSPCPTRCSPAPTSDRMSDAIHHAARWPAAGRSRRAGNAAMPVIGYSVEVACDRLPMLPALSEGLMRRAYLKGRTSASGVPLGQRAVRSPP